MNFADVVLVYKISTALFGVYACIWSFAFAFQFYLPFLTRVVHVEKYSLLWRNIVFCLAGATFLLFWICVGQPGVYNDLYTWWLMGLALLFIAVPVWLMKKNIRVVIIPPDQEQ